MHTLSTRFHRPFHKQVFLDQTHREVSNCEFQHCVPIWPDPTDAREKKKVFLFEIWRIYFPTLKSEAVNSTSLNIVYKKWSYWKNIKTTKHVFVCVCENKSTVKLGFKELFGHHKKVP